jgi:hypothetical protein
VTQPLTIYNTQRGQNTNTEQRNLGKHTTHNCTQLHTKQEHKRNNDTTFRKLVLFSSSGPVSVVRKSYAMQIIRILGFSTFTTFHSSVGIALGYGLDDRGSILGGCWEFFSKPPRPERLCGPPSLLSNGYQGLFPWG